MTTKAAKQLLADDMYARAVALYDQGYNKTQGDEPGILYRRGVVYTSDSVEVIGSTEPLEVPMEIWFFMRGATFGIGDHHSKTYL